MDNQDVNKKKLIYRSWYRGCKETDKILGYFAKKHLEGFNDAQVKEFEKILDEEDVDIYDWISGKKPMPEEYKQSNIMKMIVDFSFSDEFNLAIKPN